MAKHTPGSWEVHPEITEKRMGYIRIVAGDKRVADIFPFVARGGIRLETAEANARLIAAAPDLLEALQQAINYTQTGGAEDTDWLTNAVDAIAGAKEPA